MKKKICEKHKNIIKDNFCIDCEIEKFFYVSDKIEKDQKEKKFKKAVDIRSKKIKNN